MDVLLRVYHGDYPIIVLLLINLFLIGWCIWNVVKEIRFLRRIRSCTELIAGEVSALTEVSRGRHGSRFAPSIKYRYTGRSGYETTDFYETDHNYTYDEYVVGMEVHLFIDPADGSNVYLAGEKKAAWQNTAAMLVILLFIILAIAILV